MFKEGKTVSPEVQKDAEWAGHIQHYYEQKPGMVVAAALSRNVGVSHRKPPFLVGCSMMAYGSETGAGEYHLEFGWNETRLPAEQRGERKSIEKRCAERQAMEKIFEHKAPTVVAIVTVSKETHTGDPMKSHDALHPCRECRDMYRELLAKGIVRSGTIICSVNNAEPRKGKYPEEEMTMDELLKLYHDDESIQ